MSDETTRTDVISRKVGHCPACHDYLWGEVTVETVARTPYWVGEGAPSANTSVHTVAMSMDHHCDEREVRP